MSYWPWKLAIFPTSNPFFCQMFGILAIILMPTLLAYMGLFNHQRSFGYLWNWANKNFHVGNYQRLSRSLEPHKLKSDTTILFRTSDLLYKIRFRPPQAFWNFGMVPTKILFFPTHPQAKRQLLASWSHWTKNSLWVLVSHIKKSGILSNLLFEISPKVAKSWWSWLW